MFNFLSNLNQYMELTDRNYKHSGIILKETLKEQREGSWMELKRIFHGSRKKHVGQENYLS